MLWIARYDRSTSLLRYTNLYFNAKYQRLSPKNKLCLVSLSSLASRAANTNVPLTEKVRRKIWGTDQPPGQADPYGENYNLKKSDQTTSEPRPVETRIQKPLVNESVSQYEPATIWDGLEQVGGTEHMLNQEWLPGNTFHASFIPKDKMVDIDKITATVHRVLVEIFVWQQANYQLANIFAGPELKTDFTINVNLSYSPKMGIKLQYPDNTTMENIIRSLTPGQLEEVTIAHDSDLSLTPKGDISINTTDISKLDSVKESEENIVDLQSVSEPCPLEETSAENPHNTKETNLELINYQELVASWDPSWMNIPIIDAEIKFTFFKRILQLTGIHVSDAIITSTTTVGGLLKQIIKPPKNRKLAEVLAEKEELSMLPNVSIHPRRITLRDRETRVGRWKLIEQEFIARGLISEERRNT
ncbi:hypothetical protein HI914_02076 [Erysiphe necator]|uniref:Large ribosomal subunit protein mL50 n=1 Tax=Uncinula necator TaxID=52586 RepID=A0A0B1P8Q4_UNCNE|nr:hypothetical protein HI914_02076 [Erysiphe necator]KHJ34638.1 hypothetical protein EV44_g2854 [Erysiphe necator]